MFLRARCIFGSGKLINEATVKKVVKQNFRRTLIEVNQEWLKQKLSK